MFAHLTTRPVRVGLLDFGDGRSFLQKPLEPVNREFRDKLIGAWTADGFEVVPGDEVIWQNDIAVPQRPPHGRRKRRRRHLQFLGVGLAADARAWPGSSVRSRS